MKHATVSTILFLICSINCFAQFGADYSSYGFNFVNYAPNNGLHNWTGANITNPGVSIYQQDPTLNNYALVLSPTNETLSLNYNDCGYMDLNPCSFIVNLRAKVNGYTGNNDELSFQLFSGAVKVELDLTSSGIYYTNSANVSTLITATPPPVNQWQTYTISVNSCTGNASLMIENDLANAFPLNLPIDATPQNINLSATTDSTTPFSVEVDHLFIHSDPIKWWLGPSTAFVDDTPAGYQNTTGDRQRFLCLPNGERIGVNENGGGYITFTELMPGGPNLDPRPKFGSGGTKTLRAYFHTSEFNPVQAGISSESGGHLVDVSVSLDKSKVTVDTFPLHSYAIDSYIENSPLVFPDGTVLGNVNPLVIDPVDTDGYDEFGLDMRHELMSELDFHTCIQDISRCGEISTVKHSAEWEYIRHPSHILQFNEVTQRQRPNFGGGVFGSDTDLGEMRHKFEFRLNRDLGYEWVLCKDANNQWQATHLSAIGDDKAIEIEKDTPKNQRFMVFSTSPNPDAPGGVAWYYPESAVNCNGSVGKSRDNKAVMYTDDRRTSVRLVADWRKTNWMRMNLYIRNEGLMAPPNGDCDIYEAFQMEAHQLFGTPNEIMMEVLSYCEEPIAVVVTGGTFCAGVGNFSLSGTPNTIVTYNINGGTTNTVALDATGMATVAASNTSTLNLVGIADLGTPDCIEPITGSADVTILNMTGTFSVMGGTFCAGESASFSISGTPNTSVTYHIDGGTPVTINLDATGMAIVVASNTSTLNLVNVASSGTTNCMESLTANVTILDAIATPIVTGGTFCAGTNAYFSLLGDPNTIVSYNIGGGTTTITLDAFGNANIPVLATSTLNLQSVAYPTNPSCSRTITGSGSEDVVVLDAISATSVSGSNTICNGDPAVDFTFTGPVNSVITYTLNGVQATIIIDPSGTAILAASNTSTSTVSLLTVNDGGCIATLYDIPNIDATITVENCVIPSYNWSFLDPCNCTNPANITLADGTLLFADFIRVDASEYTNPMVSLASADANFLDNTGVPMDVANATFIAQGGGIFMLPFYALTNAPASFVVEVNGETQAGNSNACSCPSNIPTLTQWGLLIYGLLILNLFVGILYRKEMAIE